MGCVLDLIQWAVKMLLLVFSCVRLTAAGGMRNAAASPACPSMQNNTCYKFPGYSFPPVATVDLCCAACVNDGNCSAYTWLDGADAAVGRPPSACHLKSAGENKTISVGCISGIVRPPQPQPPSPSPSPSPPVPPART